MKICDETFKNVFARPIAAGLEIDFREKKFLPLRYSDSGVNSESSSRFSYKDCGIFLPYYK